MKTFDHGEAMVGRGIKHIVGLSVEDAAQDEQPGGGNGISQAGVEHLDQNRGEDVGKHAWRLAEMVRTVEEVGVSADFEGDAILRAVQGSVSISAGNGGLVGIDAEHLIGAKTNSSDR